jgi:hypothetical protein
MAGIGSWACRLHVPARFVTLARLVSQSDPGTTPAVYATWTTPIELC